MRLQNVAAGAFFYIYVADRGGAGGGSALRQTAHRFGTLGLVGVAAVEAVALGQRGLGKKGLQVVMELSKEKLLAVQQHLPSMEPSLGGEVALTLRSPILDTLVHKAVSARDNE